MIALLKLVIYVIIGNKSTQVLERMCVVGGKGISSSCCPDILAVTSESPHIYHNQRKM